MTEDTTTNSSSHAVDATSIPRPRLAAPSHCLFEQSLCCRCAGDARAGAGRAHRDHRPRKRLLPHGARRPRRDAEGRIALERSDLRRDALPGANSRATAPGTWAGRWHGWSAGRLMGCLWPRGRAQRSSRTASFRWLCRPNRNPRLCAALMPFVAHRVPFIILRVRAERFKTLCLCRKILKLLFLLCVCRRRRPHRTRTNRKKRRLGLNRLARAF